MKILMVLTYYHPHWTGLTAYAKRLAEGLVRRGHEVTVLTSRHDASLPREDSLAGVRIVRLPVTAAISRGVVMPSFPAAAWRLVREADIVQQHGPLMEAPVVALIAKLAGRPSVFTNHGDLVMPAGAFNRLVQHTVTTMMSAALRLSTRVTTHSADYARHSDFLSPVLDKTETPYPPVEIPAPDRAAADAWKNSLGLSGKRLVGFAGRWVEEKGFDVLLRAIPRVLEKRPDAHFVYAGDPDIQYEDFFERSRGLLAPVRDHVTMLGLIRDPRRLAEFYAMCDVFALSSRTDCFPSTQLEALACGTPLVSADIPGAREVVAVTGMGVHVRPRDPKDLARGILQVLGDPSRYVRPPGEIRRVFDLEKSVSDYEDLFRRVLAEAA
jgi:glycosyltransferase involved in cell wall biosynthesis